MTRDWPRLFWFAALLGVAGFWLYKAIVTWPF